MPRKQHAKACLATAANGDYSMSFALYDAASGGTALYSETATVPVSAGRFAVVIGDGGTLLQSAVRGQELWLQIAVESAALGTRQRVNPAPVSTTAQTAHSLTTTTDRTTPWSAWRDMLHMDDTHGQGAITLGDMLFGLHDASSSFYWADQGDASYAMVLETATNTLRINSLQALTGSTLTVKNNFDVQGNVTTTGSVTTSGSVTMDGPLTVGQGGSPLPKIRTGTIGTCGNASANVASGTTVNFGTTFSAKPKVFLSIREEDDNGCTSARVWTVTTTSFRLSSFLAQSTGDVAFPCDCIDWMAIGDG